MPIRFENQPIGAGGLAAYATGQGRARERALERSLNIYRDEQIRQARREEQLRQQQWADQRQARQEAFQYSRDVSQFRQESMLRDQAAERASQAAKQKLAADLASEQYELAKPQFDAMIKDMGGSAINKSDSPEVEAFKNRIATYQQYEQKASENVAAGEGKLTPQQFHSIAASEMGKILRDFDPDKHVVPLQDRPGAQYPKGGYLYQRSKNPEEEDTLIGWAPDSMLTPEGIAERDAAKKAAIDTVNGVPGQWVPGRYGMEFKPIKADASGISPEKRMTWIMSLAEKSRSDPSQPINLEAAAKEVDKLLQSLGESPQVAGGSAPGQQPAAHESTASTPVKVEVGANGKTVKTPLRPMPPSNMYPPQNNPGTQQPVASVTGGKPFPIPVPGYGTGETPAHIPAISNDAEWSRLPSGSEFIGPDGKRYRKK